MAKAMSRSLDTLKISGSSLRWRLGGFLRGEGAYMQYVTEAEKKPNEVYAQATTH